MQDALFEQFKLAITPERAAAIRKLRVEDGASFRVLAAECVEAWHVDWPKIQPVGEMLCQLAMQHFKESWDDGWN